MTRAHLRRDTVAIGARDMRPALHTIVAIAPDNAQIAAGPRADRDVSVPNL
jgi:hypothetical protein